MNLFQTKYLPDKPDVKAPDGSDVRIMLNLKGGSMAHFELASGQTSLPVAHRSVEELWFFLQGRGEMWRKLDQQEEVVSVECGVCISIPVNTHFQFRSIGDEPLTAVAVTMPPWPGENETFEVVGKWQSLL